MGLFDSPPVYILVYILPWMVDVDENVGPTKEPQNVKM